MLDGHPQGIFAAQAFEVLARAALVDQVVAALLVLLVLKQSAVHILNLSDTRVCCGQLFD